MQIDIFMMLLTSISTGMQCTLGLIFASLGIGKKIVKLSSNYGMRDVKTMTKLHVITCTCNLVGSVYLLATEIIKICTKVQHLGTIAAFTMLPRPPPGNVENS